MCYRERFDLDGKTIFHLLDLRAGARRLTVNAHS
jgi:hypothetical protein